MFNACVTHMMRDVLRVTGVQQRSRFSINTLTWEWDSSRALKKSGKRNKKNEKERDKERWVVRITVLEENCAIEAAREIKKTGMRARPRAHFWLALTSVIRIQWNRKVGDAFMEYTVMPSDVLSDRSGTLAEKIDEGKLYFQILSDPVVICPK